MMALSVLSPNNIPFLQPHIRKFQVEEDVTHLDTLKGWPMYLDSPLAWDGAQFQSEEEYTYLLTDQDKLEIETALASFKSQLSKD
jgi:hypothetical protein